MERYQITSFEDYGREPILRRMPDGTLVCLFLTGGPTEPHNENVVAIARSTDDGAHWSSPEPLFTHAQRGCWSTELFTGADRPWAFVQTYNADGHYRELQTYRSFTDDSGKTWSEPVSIRGTINGCSIRQGIVMSNGEYLFPLYWQEVNEEFSWSGPFKVRSHSWPFVSGVGISSDGVYFTRYGDLRADISLWEPNAVEAEPGHILLYCRSCRGYLYRSESTDYGRTWTPAEITDIPNPDTKLTLVKIRSKIFLINNFNAARGFNKRTNLSIAVSGDGIHFSCLFPLDDPDKAFFYPHAFADNEKETLYVAYENAKQHRLVKIPYSELGV